jgi:predicted TIM-barrel fold metal-dependent hydrolase
MRVTDVDAGPLARLVRTRPGLRLVLLNALATVSGHALQELAAVENVWFEIAAKEGVGGVAELLKIVPPQRVLFGSHLPLYNLQSAILKIREAGLEEGTRNAVERENARRLLAATES